MLCVDCHFIDTYSIQLRILIVIYKRPQATIKLWILYGFQLVLFMEGDKMKKNEGRRNLVPSASLSEWMERTEHNNRQIVKSYFLGFLCVHTIVFLVFDTSNDRPTLLNIQFLCVNLHVIFISLSMFRVSSRWTQCSMFNAHIHVNLIKRISDEGNVERLTTTRDLARESHTKGIKKHENYKRTNDHRYPMFTM